MRDEGQRDSQEYFWVADKSLPKGVERAVLDPKDPESPGFLYQDGDLITAGNDFDAISQRRARVRKIGDTGLSLLRYEGLKGAEFFREAQRLTAPGGGFHYNYIMVPAFHPFPEPAAAPEELTEGMSFSLATGDAGTGVTGAVLDSGIDPQFDKSMQPDDDHAETPPAPNGILDRAGCHGTFIAGLIKQQAPGATILSFKVFGADGLIRDHRLAQSLEALPRGIDVLNLSFGGPRQADGPDVRALPASQTALTRLLEERPELVVVASAGNDGVDLDWWPAADPHERVYSVAALSQEPNEAGGPEGACFTNHGRWVDLCTEGDGLVSTFFTFTGRLKRPAGVELPTKCFPSQDDDFFQRSHNFTGAATWSGTSFAAARVSGCIAAKSTAGGAPKVAAELAEGERITDSKGRELGVRVSCDETSSGAGAAAY